MAINNIQAQQDRDKQEKIAQEQGRLRVRALELQRQRKVLENDLNAVGASDDQRIFLEKRISTISLNEDTLSERLAFGERQLREMSEREEASQLETVSAPRQVSEQATINQTVSQRIKILSRQRVLQLQKNYEQEGESDGIAQLKTTHKPALFGFISLFIAAVTIDIFNIALWYFGFGFGAVGDIAIDVFIAAFMFLAIRAFINRGGIASAALGFCLLAGGFCVTVLGPTVVAPIFGIILLTPVAIAGIWNPGVRVRKVSKKQVTERIQKFEQKIQQAQKVASKVNSVLGLISKDSWLFRNVALLEGVSEFFGWLPWQSFTIIVNYLGQRKDYKNTQILLAEYEQKQIEAFDAEFASIQEPAPLPQVRIIPAPQPPPPRVQDIRVPTATTTQLPVAA